MLKTYLILNGIGWPFWSENICIKRFCVWKKTHKDWPCVRLSEYALSSKNCSTIIVLYFLTFGHSNGLSLYYQYLQVTLYDCTENWTIYLSFPYTFQDKKLLQLCMDLGIIWTHRLLTFLASLSLWGISKNGTNII